MEIQKLKYSNEYSNTYEKYIIDDKVLNLKEEVIYSELINYPNNLLVMTNSNLYILSFEDDKRKDYILEDTKSKDGYKITNEEQNITFKKLKLINTIPVSDIITNTDVNGLLKDIERIENTEIKNICLKNINDFVDDFKNKKLFRGLYSLKGIYTKMGVYDINSNSFIKENIILKLNDVYLSSESFIYTNEKDKDSNYIVQKYSFKDKEIYSDNNIETIMDLEYVKIVIERFDENNFIYFNQSNDNKETFCQIKSDGSEETSYEKIIVIRDKNSVTVFEYDDDDLIEDDKKILFEKKEGFVSIVSHEQKFEFKGKKVADIINVRDSFIFDFLLLDNKELWCFFEEDISDYENKNVSKILLEKNCDFIDLIPDANNITTKIKTNNNIYYFVRNSYYLNVTILDTSKLIKSIKLSEEFKSNTLIPLFLNKKYKKKQNMFVFDILSNNFNNDFVLENIDKEFALYDYKNKCIFINDIKIELNKEEHGEPLYPFCNIKNKRNTGFKKIYMKENYMFTKSNCSIFLFEKKNGVFQEPNNISVENSDFNFEGMKIFNEKNLPDEMKYISYNEFHFIYNDKKEKSIFKNEQVSFLKF